MHIYSIPNVASESVVTADYFKTAIEKHNPDAIMLQIDSSMYYSATHKYAS